MLNNGLVRLWSGFSVMVRVGWVKLNVRIIMG